MSLIPARGRKIAFETLKHDLKRYKTFTIVFVLLSSWSEILKSSLKKKKQEVSLKYSPQRLRTLKVPQRVLFVDFFFTALASLSPV